MGNGGSFTLFYFRFIQPGSLLHTSKKGKRRKERKERKKKEGNERERERNGYNRLNCSKNEF